MDFLNKFKDQVDGKDDEHKSSHDSATAATTATTHSADQPQAHERDFLGKLIAGSGSHHSLGHHGDDGEGSFLDKITRKEEREKKQLELAKREAELKVELEHVARQKKENEGFFDRIRDKFDGVAEGEGEQQQQHHHHQHKQEEAGEDDKPSFFDKLTGKEEREKKAAELDRKEEELRAELVRVQKEKEDNLGMLERLREKLDGDDKDEEEKRQKAHHEVNFFDKITGKAAEEERRRKEEENKSAFDKIKDKVEEGMGGGRKAEQEEDFLDKSELFSTPLHLRPLTKLGPHACLFPWSPADCHRFPRKPLMDSKSTSSVKETKAMRALLNS